MQSKYVLIFILSIVFLNASYSQKYNSVDSIVDNYPKNIINADQLLVLIKKDFSKQDEKARAVFRWVTTVIAYDVDLAKSMDYKSINAFSYKTQKEMEIKEKKFKLDLVTNTMISKIGVCHSYAALVEYLCVKLGLEAKIIIGNLKSDPSQIGELPEVLNHAWNVVKIDNNWKFIDATLGAGFISSSTNLFKFYFNESYFLTDPDQFFLNHYPSDENWLLTAKNKKDFAQLPLFFGYYFQYNYQMTKPESGLYTTVKNGVFTFAIKGLNTYDDVAYSYSDDNKMNYLEQEDNLKDFNIQLAKKKNGYLTLFVNRKIIAVYKIVFLE
ncbi:transglutaminase domain-containing protein [Flavobacterium sp. XS2P39]|uniref:transglutaminase domain-containing protein n=1 Tax=Flavobacterium sp. XS2P39 TaxID=3401725 RepID=UPI003AB017BE